MKGLKSFALAIGLLAASMVALGDPLTDASIQHFSGLRDGSIGVAKVEPIMEGSSDQSLFSQYNTQPIVSSHYQTLNQAGQATVAAAVMDSPLSLSNANLFTQAVYGESKPIPQSFVQPMMDRATSSKAATVTAPIQSSFPAAKRPQPIKEFKFVNSPIMAEFQTLPVIELATVVQPYAVPQTHTTQENIKQPITQPIWQPYLQRYSQQAVPVVQPIVNRVVQPVIHRQLRPFLTSETVQGPSQAPLTNAPILKEYKNEPIVGSDLAPLALDDRSMKPSLPVVEPQPDLSKRQPIKHSK